MCSYHTNASKGGVAVKNRENPGIAKKGGLTPAKIFLVDLTKCTEANLK